LKRFIVGLIIGFLLATAIGATASSNIRLVVNGREIETDVPPQLINGRVMVPARFVAEPLGATVEWDGENMAVIIQSNPNFNTLIDNNNITINLNEWISIKELYGSKLDNYPKAFDYQNQLFNELNKLPEHQNKIFIDGNSINVFKHQNNIYFKKDDLEFMK